MRVKAGDILLCLAVLLIAGLLFFSFGREPGNTASIYQDGVCIRVLSLRENTRIEVDGAYHSVIEVKDGKIGFVEADCPDQTCVHTGMLSTAGSACLCLPGRVEIRVDGADNKHQLDAITS